MFHQRNGFYAERLPNGSVRLVKKNRPSIIELAHGVTEGETVMDHSIPAAEWASIVAAVSAGGETSETYAAARALHDATDAGGAANGSSVPDQTRRIVVYDARHGRGGLDVPVGCTVGEAALLAAEMFGVRVGPNDRPSFGLRGTGLHPSDPLPDDEDYDLFVIGGTV